MNIIKKFSKAILATAVAACVLSTTAIPTFAAGKHTVTFMYGTKCVQQVVDDGCNALPPTDTYAPGFVFTGWVGNTVNVKCDSIVYGSYVKVPTQPVAPAPVIQPSVPNICPTTYQVVFKDGLTGAEFYHQTVSAGADATGPEVPHHDGYHFDHFDGSFTNVTSDRTITAIYEMDYYDTCWNEDFERLTHELWLADLLGLYD